MFVGIFGIFRTYVLKIIRKIIHILNGNLKKHVTFQNEILFKTFKSR